LLVAICINRRYLVCVVHVTDGFCAVIIMKSL